MKKLLLCFFLLLNIIYAEESPYSKIEIVYKNPIVMRTGGENDFEININLPQRHYIYLSHANSDGIGIITKFNIPTESGFQMIEVNRPKGIKKLDEMVLKDNGVFKFKIFELGQKKTGSNTKVTFDVRLQLCEEKENPICYAPKTMSKELIIEIREDKKTISYRGNESVTWETDYQSAISKAKSKNLNIYAIITEPSWCGACRYMEKEAFSKQEVQKALKEKFIPWKINDTEYSKVPIGSGSFGIPMYFVLDSSGASKGKWSGARDGNSLLALLKPFEKTNSNPDIPTPTPQLDSDELEVKGSDGGKCILTYGKDYIWIAQKSGEFYNDGKFRFGINNKEVKVKQITRDASARKSYPVKFTTLGFRIEKTDSKEFWVVECKNSLLVGKLEGTDIEFFIEK